MYDLYDLGRHIDSGMKEDGACADLVDHLIRNNPRVEPARGPSERTQGWLPRQFDHGIFLLGEPIKTIHTFQAHVTRLATETEM